MGNDQEYNTSAAELASEVQRMKLELDRARRELDLANERLSEKDKLLSINPDTGILVYRQFYTELERLVEFNSIAQPQPFAVAMVRLDSSYQRIKNTKDRSKALLFKTTIRIREVMGEALYQSDRLDEFYLLMNDFGDAKQLHRDLYAMVREVAKPHEGIGETISFGCMVGFAVYPEHGAKSQDLLMSAEIALRYAMYRKKNVVEYSAALGDAYFRSVRLEQDLHQATQNGFENFFMVYQPFVDEGNAIRGCESLIRWKHPEFGFIPPPQFIPIAERTGDIRILGRWILYKSCLELREWHRLGHPDVFVSVNLSPVQFTQHDLVQNIAEVVAATGLEGRHIKLEITEGAIMTDPDDAVNKLNALRKLGIRISIDDFGTGYSSLNYLRKLPIDTLKIDKSFIDDVTVNVQNQEIVRAIISMAQSLHIETLAEGVETVEQRNFLVGEGCKYIQGYYFSKPVEPAVFAGYLRAGGQLPPA